MKQGLSFSLIDNKFNYLSTIEVFDIYGFKIECGYAGAEENTGHKLVGVISYPLIKLKDYIEVPILDLLEANIGLYTGIGRIDVDDGWGNGNNEVDAGISLTILSIKW